MGAEALQEGLPSVWQFGAWWALFVVLVFGLRHAVERWKERRQMDKLKRNGQVGRLRYRVLRSEITTAAGPAPVTVWEVHDGPVCMGTGIAPIKSLDEADLEVEHAARIAKAAARAILFDVVPAGSAVG